MLKSNEFEMQTNQWAVSPLPSTLQNNPAMMATNHRESNKDSFVGDEQRFELFTLTLINRNKWNDIEVKRVNFIVLTLYYLTDIGHLLLKKKPLNGKL